MTSVLEQDPQVKPAPPIEHAEWCARDRHDYSGERDQWCQGAAQVVEGETSTAADPNLTRVYVFRYSGEYDGQWRHRASGIALECSREVGADLSPAEAREVARNLLAAADVAEGVAR